MINYDRLPFGLRGAVYRYVEFGVPPGDFLTAVLCNDLRAACGLADDNNRGRLFEIVSWFYNEAPEPCWGSPERVRAWVERQTPRRAEATREEITRYAVPIRVSTTWNR